MTRLSSAVLMQVQQFLLEIHAAGNLETLRRLIPEGASRLGASDRANFNQFDVAEQQRNIVPSPVPAYWRQLSPVILAHMHEHVLGDPARVPSAHNAFTFSDRRNDPTWKKSTLFHEYYIPAGVRHQLFAHLFQEGTTRWSLAFNRARQDFYAHDRSLLELISPHIECAWRNASELARLRRLPSTGDVTTEEREHTVVVDTEACRITALSFDAADVLRELFGVEVREGDGLPEELNRWLKHQRAVLASPAMLDRPPPRFQIDRGSGRVDVHLAQTDLSTAVIFLKRRQATLPYAPPPNHPDFGLTRREAEVLHWLGEGKRNSEIALILGISPRTVGKHVEHVLEKLGVETRTSAARCGFDASDPTIARGSSH